MRAAADRLRHTWLLACDQPYVYRTRVVACIYRRGKLISTGYNQVKSHPLQRTYAKHEQAIYLHAEIDAIRNALKRVPPEYLSQCEIYIARAKKSQDRITDMPALAAPCKGCAAAITAFGFKSVFYTE